MKLMREIRCFLSGREDEQAEHNSWAGRPTSDALDPYVVIQTVIEGDVDAQTGYVCNIKLVDQMMHDHVLPRLRAVLAKRSGPQRLAIPGLLLRLHERLIANCPAGTSLVSFTLRPSPQAAYTLQQREPSMVRTTIAFEFSASHRLACPDYSDERNREVFGKCSSKNGHGHNYVVEVTVAGNPHPETGQVVPLPGMQRVVNENVIEVFDHKNLNMDCEDFATLNPSVENIARVIWQRLEGKFASGDLAAVRVWETPKTWAEYAGEPAV